MLSESTEMYLITVYRLGGEGVHVNAIADLLNVHHSSVSEKVKRLAEQGYLAHEVRGSVALTEEGHEVALNVLRKHRLVKTFLVKMAGYSIDEVYEEACRLEHVVSDRLANSLEALLSNPQFDPHGNPIPARDGSVKEITYQSLNDYGAGDVVLIRRVDALHQEKLSYLMRLGLVPGAEVHIQEVGPFDGPLMLSVQGKIVAIAPSLAQEIEVSRLDTPR